MIVSPKDGVDPDLHHRVRSPDVTPDQNSRSVMLDEDYAEEIESALNQVDWDGTAVEVAGRLA